jgi:hypothetical protein
MNLGSHGWNVCVSLKFICWNLISSVSRSGAFGKVIRHLTAANVVKIIVTHFDSSRHEATIFLWLEPLVLRRLLYSLYLDIRGHPKTSLAHGCTWVSFEIRKVP